jgi:hypothetical protein
MLYICFLWRSHRHGRRQTPPRMTFLYRYASLHFNLLQLLFLCYICSLCVTECRSHFISSDDRTSGVNTWSASVVFRQKFRLSLHNLMLPSVQRNNYICEFIFNMLHVRFPRRLLNNAVLWETAFFMPQYDSRKTCCYTPLVLRVMAFRNWW